MARPNREDFMRTINNSPSNTQFGSSVENLMKAILVREVQALAMHATLTDKELNRFEKLWNMLFKTLKTSEREDYRVFVLANNLKDIDQNDPFYKQIQAIMSEKPQITSED